MAAGSLRPHIVRVMSEHRERPLSTGEIYEAVATTGVAGFDPRAKRDRNLVNRELSGLAGMSPESHSKPAPHLLARVGRGRYIFREPELPWTWPWCGSTWNRRRFTRSGRRGGGVPHLGGTGHLSRCGRLCLRCSGASAPVAVSTCRIT